MGDVIDTAEDVVASRPGLSINVVNLATLLLELFSSLEKVSKGPMPWAHSRAPWFCVWQETYSWDQFAFVSIPTLQYPL